MDKRVVRHDVLWMATDDWTGLWEVAWFLQSMWPDLRGQPAKEEGRALLTELLNEDLIYLCMFEGRSNKETPVSRDKAHKLLGDPKNFEPPGGFIAHVRFATTEKGEKLMFALEAELQESK